MVTSYIYCMIEKEITETYYFVPSDFNERGRRISDGVTFRDIVKDFERDFHERHSTEYALNLYANSQTMDLLAKFTKWRSVVRRFMYMVLTLLL